MYENVFGAGRSVPQGDAPILGAPMSRERARVPCMQGVGTVAQDQADRAHHYGSRHP